MYSYLQIFNISIDFRHSFSLQHHVKIQSNTWRVSTWLILRQLCYQHQHLTFLSAFLHHNFFCYVCLTKSQYYYTIKEFCCHYFLANWYKHFLKAFCGNSGYSCDLYKKLTEWEWQHYANLMSLLRTNDHLTHL